MSSVYLSRLCCLPQIEKKNWIMRMKRVKVADNGSYTCIINNSYGELRWTFTLHVYTGEIVWDTSMGDGDPAQAITPSWKKYPPKWALPEKIVLHIRLSYLVLDFYRVWVKALGLFFLKNFFVGGLFPFTEHVFRCRDLFPWCFSLAD